MTDTTKRIRDGLAVVIAVIAILTSVFGWVHERGRRAAQDALLHDQVDRNKMELEAHDLDVIEYQLNEMDKKLDKIDEKLDNLTQ